MAKMTADERELSELCKEIDFSNRTLKESYFLWYGDSTHIGFGGRSWVLTPRHPYAVQFATESIPLAWGPSVEGEYHFRRVGNHFLYSTHDPDPSDELLLWGYRADIVVSDDNEQQRVWDSFKMSEIILTVLADFGIERRMVVVIPGVQRRVS